MKLKKFTYANAEGAFYEAMRVELNGKEIETDREINSCIHPEKTYLNKVFLKHDCLDASHFAQRNRGRGIANYHKAICKRSPRLNGEPKQQSRALGCIVTLPKDYFGEDLIKNLLTPEELNYFLSEEYNENTALGKQIEQKLINIEWTPEQRREIDQFLEKSIDAFCEVTGIKKEYLLYAVGHYDETWPHLHITALPFFEETAEKDLKSGRGIYAHKGEKYIRSDMARFSITNSKDADGKTFFDRFHPEMIKKLEEKGITQASKLLNGATKEQKFDPADFEREQRERTTVQAMRKRELQKQIDEQQKQIIEQQQQNEELTQMIQEIYNDSQANLVMIERRLDAAQNLFNKFRQNVKTYFEELIQKFIQTFKPQFKKAVTQEERENILNKAENLGKKEILEKAADIERQIDQLKPINDPYREQKLKTQRIGLLQTQMPKKAKEYAERQGISSADIVDLFKEPDIIEMAYKEYAITEEKTKKMSETEAIEYRKFGFQMDRCFKYVMDKLKNMTETEMRQNLIPNKSLYLWMLVKNDLEDLENEYEDYE